MSWLTRAAPDGRGVDGVRPLVSAGRSAADPPGTQMVELGEKYV